MYYPMHHQMHCPSRFALVRPWLTGGLLTLFLWVGLWSPSMRLAAQQDPQVGDVLGSITGRVTDDTGAPLADIVVTLYKATSYSGYDATTVTTDSTGAYRFRYVPTGTYRLGFRDPAARVAALYYPDAEQIEFAADLPIAGNHLTQPPVMLTRTGSITGLVTTFSVEAGRITAVTLYRGDQALWPQDYAFTQAQTAQGLSYQLRGLRPALYRLGLTVTLNNGDRYEEYYADAVTDLAAALIPVAAGQVVEPINFQIGDNPQLANLTGQVVDSTTGQPIQGLRVTAYLSAPGSDLAWLARSTTTDSNGVYHLRTLNPGLYKIGFVDPLRRYPDRYYPQRNSVADALLIELNAGATITMAHEPLPLAGKIAGSITLFDGAKPAGRRVQLFSANLDVPTVVAEDYLNADEDFSFDLLPPGAYRLLASSSYNGVAYAEYFQGAFDLRDAQPITITAGGQVQEIHFILGQRTAYGAITGELQDAANTPLAGITVAAWIWQSDIWQPLASTKTDVAGTYGLAPLKPGTYRVCFEDAGQRVITACFQSAPNQEAPIRVLAGETTGNINATLTRTGSIAGTITFLPNPPLVSALTVYKQVGTAWMPIRELSVQRTNEERFPYLLAGLDTGIYRLKLAGYNFTQYYGGATDLMDATDIAVRFGEATPAIDFVAGQDTQQARIEGLVTVGGVAQAGIQVELYYSTCCDYWQRLVYVTTDAAGRYTIDGLATGNYRLAFVDPNRLLPTLYLGAPRPVEPTTAIDIRDAKTIAVADPQAVIQIQVDMQSGAERFPRPFFLPLIMR